MYYYLNKSLALTGMYVCMCVTFRVSSVGIPRSSKSNMWRSTLSTETKKGFQLQRMAECDGKTILPFSVIFPHNVPSPPKDFDVLDWNWPKSDFSFFQPKSTFFTFSNQNPRFSLFPTKIHAFHIQLKTIPHVRVYHGKIFHPGKEFWTNCLLALTRVAQQIRTTQFFILSTISA